MSKTVLITGGTGLVGKRLTELLRSKGYKVIIATRNLKSAVKHEAQADENISYARWNVDEQSIDKEALQKADYIVHLAGAGIADKRWTSKRKKEIINSRTQSSALIARALKEIPNQVKAVISASAIGYYGADPALPNKHPFTEDAIAADNFLGNTCKMWEQSIQSVKHLQKRLVTFRIGIVLSNEGGALAAFKKPVKFGIASILGSGKQIISWIHIDDLCRLFLYAIENESLNGVFNAVAPQPISNKELMLQLAKKMRGKAFIAAHVPSFVLKTMLGEMSIEVLKSTTVSCEKIHKEGFTFLYPSVDAALNELV